MGRGLLGCPPAPECPRSRGAESLLNSPCHVWRLPPRRSPGQRAGGCGQAQLCTSCPGKGSSEVAAGKRSGCRGRAQPRKRPQLGSDAKYGAGCTFAPRPQGSACGWGCTGHEGHSCRTGQAAVAPALPVPRAELCPQPCCCPSVQPRGAGFPWTWWDVLCQPGPLQTPAPGRRRETVQALCVALARARSPHPGAGHPPASASSPGNSWQLQTGATLAQVAMAK